LQGITRLPINRFSIKFDIYFSKICPVNVSSLKIQ
jgi:hypothetical protein